MAADIPTLEDHERSFRAACRLWPSQRACPEWRGGLSSFRPRGGEQIARRSAISSIAAWMRAVGMQRFYAIGRIADDGANHRGLVLSLSWFGG